MIKLNVKKTIECESYVLINSVSEYLKKGYDEIENEFFSSDLYPIDNVVRVKLTCDIDQERNPVKKAIYAIMEDNNIEEMIIV